MARTQIVIGWSNAELAAGVAAGRRIVDGFGHHVETALDLAGIGLGIEGIRQFTEEFAKFGAMSRELNEAPEALQRLSYIAKENNTDVNTVTKALQKLGLALRDTGDEKSQSALKELNIDASEFLRLSPEQQLISLAESFQAAEKRGGGLSATYDLLGKNAGALLPILRGNIDALREMAGAPVLSAEQIQTLDEFGTEWTRLIDKQRVQLADFALTSVRFAKAFAAGWHESANIFSDEFGNAFRKTTAAQAEHARISAIAAEEGRKFARALAAEREEAERNEQAFKKFSKALSDTVEEHEKLRAKISSLEGQREGIKLDLGVDDQKKLQDAQRKLELINSQIYDVQANPGDPAADEEALARLYLEQKQALNEILALKRQINNAAETEAKRAAQERDGRLESIRRLEEELNILRLRASGHEKAAAAAERELKIRQDTVKIAHDLNLSYEQANQLAREKADLEDQIARKEDRRADGRSRIHGYKQSQGSASPFRGLDELDRLNRIGPDGKRETAFQDRFWTRNHNTTPGLDNFNRLQDRSQPAFNDRGAQHGKISTASIEKILSQLLQSSHGIEKNLTAY